MRAFSHIPLPSYRRLSHWLVSLLGLLLFGMACADAHANTFVVTNLSDSDFGSLRKAITEANANPGADTIVFDSGLAGTITLLTALPNLTGDVTLTGPGAKLLTIARGSATPFRILTIDAGAATPPTVQISGLTLTNGLILPTTAGNYYGGGVLSNKANVAFTDCAISGNSISLPNPNPFPPPIGGLNPGHDNYNFTFGFGGGIYNYQGVMTLTRCTLSNNITNSAASQAKGGGLLNDAGTLTLTNCTLSGNQAVSNAVTHYYGGLGGYPTYTNGSAWGGAISNSGTLNLTGCTFARNSTVNHNITFGPDGWGISSDVAGVGSSVYNDGASSSTHVTLYQTILASGSYGQNVISATGIVLTSLGYNLSNDATGPNDGVTDRLNMDAKLSPLADHGGQTPTHLPLPGSPARDGGDPNFNGNPATDQRGLPRVFNGRVDIGAVELQVVELGAGDDAYSVKHDHTLRVAAPGVLANDTGAAALSAVLVASAAHGTLLLNADGSFVYTPNAGYGVTTNSADSFTYAVQDGSGRTSNVATVTITIIPDNAPVLTNSLTGTTTAGQIWNFTATATDADLPDDALTFALVNAPSGMTINAATGAIAWKSQTEGTTTFDIKVTDRYGKSDTKTFMLTVQSDPNAPVSLSITNVALQRSSANTVTVSFLVVNSRAGRATNLVIARATLGGWLAVVNSSPMNVGAGGRQAYTLTFSGAAPLRGVVYPLQIRGTYQAQNITQSLFYGGGVIVP